MASSSRVDLSSMPVINLTQNRAAGSSSANANAQPLRNNDEEMDSETGSNVGDGDPRGAGGNGAWNNRYKLVPRPDDEPPLVCKLSGNTVSSFTELCGWSYLLPTKFYNININTRLHSMSDGRGEVVPAAEALRTRAITLAEMEQLVGGIDRVISCPVFVQVIAKKKVDVVAHNGKILVIPLVVIADESGYCVLCSFNEGVATIYNEVEVGDKLLITRCLPQVPRANRIYHRGLFSEDMFLNLELKLQFHSVRNHYLWKFSPLKLIHFKMPATLFDNSCQLRIPSELETELHNPTRAPSLNATAKCEQYYDLIGVVTYVGRIERFENTDPQNLECIQDGETIFKKVPRYVQHRWIYLVDETSQAFPVKLYVNNLTTPHQAVLAPGAIVVLSHCQTKTCPYSGSYTATSQFTQIYVEGNIEKYVMIHPTSFRDQASKLLSREQYVRIVSRADIQLSIGGTHATKIKNQERFLSLYGDMLWKERDIPEDKPMARRESRRLYFQGTILRVLMVNEENVPMPHFVLPFRYRSERSKREYKMIENFQPFSKFRNSSWYSFQRKLPAFDPFILQTQKCRDIVKKMVATYKPFCAPLLMPAEIPNYCENGPPPPMADFEKIDGPPYFLLDIVNEESHIWYTCIFKNRNFTTQEMKDKIDSAKGKKVTCAAEVFCTEPDAPLEVNLLDFVIIE